MQLSPVRVHVWGAWGRQFESAHPDSLNKGFSAFRWKSFFLGGDILGVEKIMYTPRVYAIETPSGCTKFLRSPQILPDPDRKQHVCQKQKYSVYKAISHFSKKSIAIIVSPSSRSVLLFADLAGARRIHRSLIFFKNISNLFTHCNRAVHSISRNKILSQSGTFFSRKIKFKLCFS